MTHRSCGFELSDLVALETQRRHSSQHVKLPASAVAEPNWPSLPVWVAAGPLPRQPSHAPNVRRELRVRDALGELARVFFDRPHPIPIIVSWVAEVTPSLLEAAARLGHGEPSLVTVFVKPNQLNADPVANVSNWQCGRYVDTPMAAAVRAQMVNVAYRCGIIIGGTDDVDADAALLQQKHQGPPNGPMVFAVASTGGAAATRYQQDPLNFGGLTLGPELVDTVSYTLLMKHILEATLPKSPDGGHGYGGRGGPTISRHEIVGHHHTDQHHQHLPLKTRTQG